jgi:hypothetical protein
MANTYSSSLRLIIQQDGTNQGTWGGYTNTNIASLIEQAITGVGAITVSGSSNYTLTVTNGASDEARNAVLNITGTLTAAINVICPTAAKTYIVKNGTTGGFAITLKTSAGTGISVPNGKTMTLYCNGTDVVSSIDYLAGTATSATNIVGGAAGSIPYQSGSGTTSLLAASTNGYVLTLSGGLPSWASPTATGVTTFSAGTTGLTPSTASSGAVTLAGTLAVANGGTGVTTSTGTGSVVLSTSPTFTGTGNTATWNMTTPQYSGVAMSRIVQATAVATTSGTAIDFTGIPSWVKRITVMLNGVSTTGSSPVRLQAGSGTVQASGYSGYNLQYSNTSIAGSNVSAGFDLSVASGEGSSATRIGSVVFTLLSGNTWVANGTIGLSNATYGSTVSGSVTLSGTLDRVRLTTQNGTDIFDAGSINILYEG